MDQDTTVHVVTSNQVKTNAWPVLFRAAVETSFLPYGEIKHTDCGIDSNNDQCGTTYDADDFDGIYDANPWPWQCDGTICGHHYTSARQ